MAEYPALPLFTDAFIADTIHLNAMQTGAYLMLLMAAWRSPDCKLPDDDKFLARAARMDGRAWYHNKSAIMAFWHQDQDRKWYQKRLVDERIYVEALRRKNAEAGKASALKRKERHSTTVQPEFNETSTPTPTPTPNTTTNVVVGAVASAKPRCTTPAPIGGWVLNNLEDLEKIPEKACYRLTIKTPLRAEWGEFALDLGLSEDATFIEYRKFLAWFVETKPSSKTTNGWRRTWDRWVARTLERK